MPESSSSMVVGGTRVEIFGDTRSLSRAAARHFVDVAGEAIEARGRFDVALAGGSTPAGLYRCLADTAESRRIDWSSVRAFFGDERPVGPVHPDSNYRMAHECLLGPASVPEANIFRIEGERPAEEAARAYEDTLRRALAIDGDGRPRFDLVLLGMGDDAHTASLFPETTALDATDRLVVANPVAKLGTTRITLTASVLNAAAAVWFVVTGSAKADAVHAVLRGSRDPRRFPAQSVAPTDGELRWWLDEDAAARLR